MSTELMAFDPDQLALLKTTIAKGTTDDQLNLFVQVCKQTGLNPFARQIYAVMRNTRKEINGQWINTPEMTIQTSIDGYRLLAQRSGEYAGQDGPYFLDGNTKEWLDYWIESYPPVAARVGVLRKGFAKYLYAVARFESYAVREYDKATRKSDGALKNLWAKMPEVMIAKVAEALALRRAFPAELSGIYTKEEMDQADIPMPSISPVPPRESQPAIEQPAEPAQPVEGQTRVVEPLDTIPTPSQLRTRFDGLGITTKRGAMATFEQVKRAMLKKEPTDDELTPDECIKISAYLDGQELKKKAS